MTRAGKLDNFTFIIADQNRTQIIIRGEKTGAPQMCILSINPNFIVEDENRDGVSEKSDENKAVTRANNRANCQ